MQFLARRFLLVSALVMCAFNAHSGVITTGDLSYDTDTQIISGLNGVTYLGWGVAADLNFTETLAATESGGIYEDYHIASQQEAEQFFLQASGIPDPYTTVAISNGTDRDRFGANNFGDELVGSSSAAFFLVDNGVWGYGVGFVLSDDDSIEYWLDEVEISTSDEYAASGPYPNSTITWLLVSDATQTPSVSEPGSIALLGFGLVGLLAVRRRKYKA